MASWVDAVLCTGTDIEVYGAYSNSSSVSSQIEFRLDDNPPVHFNVQTGTSSSLVGNLQAILLVGRWVCLPTRL